MRPRRIVAAALLVAFVVLTLALPTQDVMATDVLDTFAAPSAAHFLGTDNLGRDVYSLMVSGCLRTIVVVVVSGVISFVGGVLLGLLAGWRGGAVEAAVTLLADLTIVVPSFILALIFAGIFGLTPLGAGVVLGIGNMGDYAVQATALTKRVLGEEFVEVERTMGISGWRIALRHLLPNIVRPLSTYLAARASSVTVQYASLAFIGVGADISNPDWGTMLYQYRTFVLTSPSLVILPMAGIAVLAVFFQLLFDRGGTDDES